MTQDTSKSIPPWKPIEVDEDGMFRVKKPLPDGRRMIIEPMTYGRVRLGICNKDFSGLLDEVYEFKGQDALFLAMLTWEPEKDPEPKGWFRHPHSRRYRIEGDPEREYIKDNEGTIEDRLAYAIAVTQGKDRKIEEIHDESAIIENVFPRGTQMYMVSSTSRECTHTPACEWMDEVFVYLDRLVVVSQSQSERMLLANVRERLTGTLLASDE